MDLPGPVLQAREEVPPLDGPGATLAPQDWVAGENAAEGKGQHVGQVGLLALQAAETHGLDVSIRHRARPGRAMPDTLPGVTPKLVRNVLQ